MFNNDSADYSSFFAPTLSGERHVRPKLLIRIGLSTGSPLTSRCGTNIAGKAEMATPGSATLLVRQRPALFPVIAGFILLAASPRNAAANCQNGSTTQTVTWATSAAASGSTLNAVLNASTKPCTITVSPGTYAAPAAAPGDFTIASGITVKSSGGPASTVLQASNWYAVSIWPIAGSCPSGAWLEGFTLEAPSGGVFVGAGSDISHPGCTSNQVSGVTLRNLIVSQNTTPLDGHGIDFHGVQNSVIDSCTVAKAFANGIFLESGSHNNIVMNSAILRAQTQHAIAVQSSNDNTIVGNTISGGPFFDGIILNSNVGLAGPGSSRNRIERNVISGHSTDGIVLTDASLANYIGLNTAVSGSYTAPNSTTNPGANGGVGVWVNGGSNAAYVYGNDLSGSAENGIDVMRSKSSYIQGNSVHGNYHGGIWIANVPDDANIAPSAPVPQDITVHGNNVFFNRFNAQLFLQGTVNTNAAFNYLSGAQGSTVNGTGTVAIRLQSATTTNVYENTVSAVGSRVFINDLGGPATSGATIFRNRFLRGTNIPNPPQTDGLNGVTYALTPSTWDGGSFLGGNHWSEFGATGNPDASHPYTGFIGNVGGGPNIDRFPFQSESLQLPLSLPNSVSVVEPVAGSVLAAGTTKTIRWVARGCALVDIYYGTGSGMALISAGFPNIGDYIWAVPAAPFGSSYSVRVVCADSNDVPMAGVYGNSPQFTIASGSLVLMTPGRGSRATNGSTLRVAWKKAATVASVNVYVKAGSGSETSFGPYSGTFADITLPAAVSNSNRVSVRIQNPSATQDQDSVNGSFMVRGSSPAFATNLSGQVLQVGSVGILEWVGPSNSYTVNLDLVGNVTISIAKNLPDFGSYTWFVPDASSSSAFIRATFKDANGNPLGSQVSSAAFGVSRSPGAPPNTSHNLAAVKHDLDGDSKSEITVFRPANGMWYSR